MKKSEFRDFVKEMFIDLINNDGEVRDIVLEFVQENSNLITELKQKEEVPKEPSDPELYDKLMLIASGKQQKLVHNGKVVKTPNYGAGFKSGKMIQEWASKAYGKIGGGWQNASVIEEYGVQNDTMSFLSSLGGGSGSDFKSIAKSTNDQVLRENIIQSGRGVSIGLTESGEFDSSQSIDVTDILADTARTTLQNFPTSHEGNLSSAASGREAFSGTPEQVFGESSNRWASLAFQGISE